MPSNNYANIGNFRIELVNQKEILSFKEFGPAMQNKPHSHKPVTEVISKDADFLAFLYEDGPLPQLELNSTDADPFAFLFREGPPLGFEKGNKFKNNIRRSPRIKEKTTGQYISSEQKACKLFGDDFIAPTPKQTNRKKHQAPIAEPKMDYLRNFDPLSGSQAEAIVSTAGVEFKEDLNFKIVEMKDAEGVPPSHTLRCLPSRHEDFKKMTKASSIFMFFLMNMQSMFSNLGRRGELGRLAAGWSLCVLFFLFWSHLALSWMYRDFCFMKKVEMVRSK